MPNITLSVTPELKLRMEEFPDINWSEVARQAIFRRAEELSILKGITSKSKMTDQDALELGRKINRSLSKRYE